MSSSAETDASTYATYLEHGESKAAAARILGIGESTVRDRVKRHLARTAADQAADAAAEITSPEPEDAPAAETPAAETVTITPGTAEEVFARVLSGEISPDDVIIEGSTAKLVSVTAPGDVTPDEIVTQPVTTGEGTHQCADPDTCTVSNCVECGWDFGHQQRRHTCGSPRACARRQAAGDPTLGRPRKTAEVAA